MPSILNPADPVKRYRGKIMQQRFNAPEGLKPGGLSSFIGAFLEYRGVVEKEGFEPSGVFDAWMSGQIDKAINPISPMPTAVKAMQSRKKKPKGRSSTIFAGLMNRRRNVLDFSSISTGKTILR